LVEACVGVINSLKIANGSIRKLILPFFLKNKTVTFIVDFAGDNSNNGAYCLWWKMALLIEFGFRTLLRYSDISRFTWENVLNKDELVLNEKKTGKKRSIKVGAVLKALLLEYYQLMNQPDLQSTIFNYSLRHTNRLLQFGSRFVGIRRKAVSTHSLRKSGARFLYEENHRSEDVFLKISMILNHSSTQVSRRYLGITKEEISDVFNGFDFVL
jgi:integrase